MSVRQAAGRGRDAAALRAENTQLRAELERRDLERATWLTWLARGYRLGYRDRRNRKRQAS